MFMPKDPKFQVILPEQCLRIKNKRVILKEGNTIKKMYGRTEETAQCFCKTPGSIPPHHCKPELSRTLVK